MWLLFFLGCVVVNEKYVKSSACLSPHGLHNDRLELKVLNAWTCRLGVSLLAVTSGRLFCLGCLGLLGGILSRLQALLELLWHGLQLTRGLAHAPRQAHKLVRALSSTRGKQQIQWHVFQSHSQPPQATDDCDVRVLPGQQRPPRQSRQARASRARKCHIGQCSRGALLRTQHSPHHMSSRAYILYIYTRQRHTHDGFTDSPGTTNVEAAGWCFCTRGLERTSVMDRYRRTEEVDVGTGGRKAHASWNRATRSRSSEVLIRRDAMFLIVGLHASHRRQTS